MSRRMNHMVEKRQQKRATVRVIIVAMAVFMMLGGSLFAETKIKKVAVIPFTMNADKDFGFLQQGIADMLATRLAWEDNVLVVEKQEVLKAMKSVSGSMSSKNAKSVGKALHADYVLFGSLTVFGKSVSMDATMLDVSGARAPVTAFNQSRGMDGVIPAINDFAKDINAKIFGRAAPAPALAPTPALGAQPAAPGTYAHPDTLIPGLGAGVPDVSQVGQKSRQTPFIMAASSGRDFWKSPNFDVSIQGLAIGDVTGDGLTETVFIGDHKIFVKKNQQGRMAAVTEYEGEKHHKFVWVDVADINGNGKAEIFVSSINASNNRAESFILEWNGSSLELVAEKQKRFFAVVTQPGQRPALYAQRGGVSDPLLPGIFKIDYEAGDYVLGSKVNVFDYVQVFGFNFADVDNAGQLNVVAFDKGDELEVFSINGKREWGGDENFGGSHKFLKIPGKEKTADRIFLAQRIIVTDLNSDNQPEILVVKNKGTASRLFKRYHKYTSAEFVSLAWDGLGLATAWQTRKISGYVVDYAVGDFDNDGKAELAVAVEQSGSLFGSKKSSIIAYELAGLSSTQQ